ncbi:ornithine cyclodeaminase family protein [Salinicoccus albus]|uniref:ornithine cyclodeaminase family protein n=1 Tax=Salinicoccus albus TaxID=418756 RepID=UPI000379807D|nr:NAD(P)-binding domain-containing protein [Salinicoccus albus]
MIRLTDEQIQEKYSVAHAIEDVKSILQDLRDDQIVQSVRTVLPAGGASSMLYMPCISKAAKTSIIKTVSIFPDNDALPTTQGNILLTDLTDGRHQATMDASYLTRLRTGAMTAIATDKLARHDASVLGVIGTGNMAFEQVLGVLEVRNVKKIVLFNRTLEKARRFKKRLSASSVQADIKVVDDVSMLADDSDIINCATQSMHPVFEGADLKPGTHVNGVGSFKSSMREMDVETIRRAGQIYVDDVDAVREEAGELIHAVKNAVISWDDIRGSLADIFDGGDLRIDDKEITLYKCVGAGYFDLAVASGVMKQFG